MNKLILIIFGFVFIISIFMLENRAFIVQYFENNKWLQEYYSENYIEAYEIFSWSIQKKSNEIVLFNIWNNFVKEAEKSENIVEKIWLLQKSIKHYEKSLDINKNDFVENNKAYAENKIDELLEQEEKEESENKWETESDNGLNNWENEESENTDWVQNQWENIDPSYNNQNEAGESWIISNSSWNSQSLSQSQTQQLEEYLEELKEIEKNNQQYFNKKTQWWDLFERFSNDPFFQNEFDRWWEKDW